MARLLQGLILAGVSAGWALAPSSFSHRLHIELGLDCGACHPGVAASLRPEDNNLPAGRLCGDCHERPMSVPAPAARRLARFSHAVHLKLGGIPAAIASAIDSGTYLDPSSAARIRPLLIPSNPCSGCHRGLSGPAGASSGVDPYPHMADCLVCHSKIDNPFSCGECHTPGPHLKPPAHTPDYLDAHSRASANLGKPSCVICHGRQFTCMGCH